MTFRSILRFLERLFLALELELRRQVVVRQEQRLFRRCLVEGQWLDHRKWVGEQVRFAAVLDVHRLRQEINTNYLHMYLNGVISTSKYTYLSEEAQPLQLGEADFVFELRPRCRH